METNNNKVQIIYHPFREEYIRGNLRAIIHKLKNGFEVSSYVAGPKISWEFRGSQTYKTRGGAFRAVQKYFPAPFTLTPHKSHE